MRRVLETCIVSSSVRPFGLRRGCSHLLLLLGLSLLAGCDEPLVSGTRRLPTLDGGASMSMSTPVTGLALDGEACAMDDDCNSGHCDQDTCCESGACCRENEDCKLEDALVCDQVSTCQGHRKITVCGLRFQCEEREPDDDDSACTAEMEADGCGLYASAHCNGKERQMAPSCPDTCDDDSGCDEAAHCNAEGECEPDLSASAGCHSDSDCVSGHCNNDICCEAGDCCNSPADCDPEKFATAATCDTPASCQGTRGVPVCEKHQCGTRKIADDSGCDLTVVANDCEGEGDVKCLGGRQQQSPPPCAGGSCRSIYDCSRSAFCDAGTCVPDRANGEACSAPDMCQSGHCETTCCSLDCCDPEHRCASMACDDVQCPD